MDGCSSVYEIVSLWVLHNELGGLVGGPIQLTKWCILPNVFCQMFIVFYLFMHTYRWLLDYFCIWNNDTKSSADLTFSNKDTSLLHITKTYCPPTKKVKGYEELKCILLLLCAQRSHWIIVPILWWVSARKNVAPLPMHWSYVFLALTHQYCVPVYIACWYRTLCLNHKRPSVFCLWCYGVVVYQQW